MTTENAPHPLVVLLDALRCALDDGWCPAMEDGSHCQHWWDCEPCHACSWDGGGAGCDCDRHTAERANGYAHVG